MRRRQAMLAALAGAVMPGAGAAAEGLEAMAQALAARPFQPPPDDLPAAARGWDYDQWRRHPFTGTPRRSGPFAVHPFPRGYLFPDAVALELDGTPWQPGAEFQDAPPGLGFSGFRLVGELNTPGRPDEVVSFLGASYFRALGRGHAYGVSARAVSLGLGGVEEFPAFRLFRLAGDGVGALLDGPSLAGAFRITVAPGAETVLELHATLFPRHDLLALGVAPASSMFWFNTPHARDPRPAVHDSDTLAWEDAAGERRARPLDNPAAPRITDIPLPSPRGFGLLQRRRGPAAFADPEARYGDRPSLWVEPLGDWGPGHLRLLELPARDEYHDTIACAWQPAAPIPAGRPFRAAWRLRWADDAPARPGLARLASARREALGTALRFAGPALAATRPEGHGILAFEASEAEARLLLAPGGQARLRRADGTAASETAIGLPA
ncbi:glucan biosynthesis protein [Roseococcus sp. DSY-14]|uniref:glucan biosynthesis protein n=1 Tax=Roseococcus sp. DSY-14 TaxID=3369650 RepID=UPI00387B4318